MPAVYPAGDAGNCRYFDWRARQGVDYLGGKRQSGGQGWAAAGDVVVRYNGSGGTPSALIDMVSDAVGSQWKSVCRKGETISTGCHHRARK